MMWVIPIHPDIGHRDAIGEAPARRHVWLRESRGAVVTVRHAHTVPMKRGWQLGIVGEDYDHGRILHHVDQRTGVLSVEAVHDSALAADPVEDGPHIQS